ncbi:hypothetical protein PBAL39_16606 [Pedobacter sp. BAL39]|uniref:hypothetical protein n=1 Tax=Pedobacter sp. BAL39 TaxID=391596 RepID=UPI000155A07B|nr:hypothetical protein [Pedobacter sp. BAL39]EDM35121.1 hypothetical protein PBAL39_16606 [Pedobacter sp. BAL39]
MKKMLFVLTFMCVSFFAKADQLAALTQEQAEKAVAYLKKEPAVILWCTCCDNDEPKKVTVNEVFIKRDADGKYCSVVLKGRDDAGNEVEEYLDLAYVFVKKGSKAHCLGKVLKFKCDPCGDPFSWTFEGMG